MAQFLVAVSLFCLVALSSAELCTRDGSYRRDYPGQCSKYVECVHGRSTVESCGWFHRFDEATNQCRFHIFGSVYCSQTYPTEEPTLAPTKASDIAIRLAEDQICTRSGTYKTFFPGNCDKYYNCNNGQPTPGSCGWFHRFDEKSADCKFHWLFIGSVDCSKALTPTKKPATPTPTTPTSASSSTSTTTTTASPNSASTKKHHNGAGSVEISMFLATICTFATIFRHLH